MSASTTLTPVVDAAARTDYGATGTVGGDPVGAEEPSRLAWLGEMRDRAIARAGAAVRSVNDRLRAAVRGDNAPPPASDERTPLRGAVDV